MTLPLNANLQGKALPSLASTQLVKTLFIGDSQFGQSSNRLMGAIQKWDIPFVGRHLGLESQSSTGIGFTAVSGSPGGQYGTTGITNTRVELGQDWGDGDTGKHFYHGRKITLSPVGIDSGGGGVNFQRVAESFLVAGGYTRAINRAARCYAKLAIYDAAAGGWGAVRISEKRTGTSGSSSDITLTGTGGVVILQRAIAAFGDSTEVGIFIRDSFGTEANRSAHLLGTLIYNSPADDEFPETGFVPMQISQSGFSASDHLTTVDEAAIDAAITMAEGFDSVFIMLCHNAEDSGDYATNIAAIRARIASRHTALSFSVPDFVFIAPWNINAGVGQIVRLRAQSKALFDLAMATGDGYISLLNFYGEAQPSGVLTTPRGTATYALDGSLVHPADAATAELIARDMEWSFNPDNFQTHAVVPVVTAASNGYNSEVPVSPEMFYDIGVTGRAARGIMVSCTTANVSVYTDTLGTSVNPIVIVAGAPPIQLTVFGGGIKKAWVSGPSNARFSWVTNIR